MTRRGFQTIDYCFPTELFKKHKLYKDYIPNKVARDITKSMYEYTFRLNYDFTITEYKFGKLRTKT